MLVAATGDEPRFAVSRVELERDGPSYTVDTLQTLRPEGELYLVIGSDAAAELGRWRDPARVRALATLLVAARPGGPDVPPGMRRLDAPLLDISSRELRARAARGRSLRYLVPEAALRYIEEHSLYR
jgi:nicotinate-nucleotide adenylyltransferase